MAPTTGGGADEEQGAESMPLSIDTPSIQVRAGLERRSSLLQLDMELLHLETPLPEN